MKIIFPSGLEINYPEANYKSGNCIYTAKDGRWIATLPEGVLIQAYADERRYINDVGIYPSVNAAADHFKKNMRDSMMSEYKLSEIKKELRKFNAKRKTWKP